MQQSCIHPQRDRSAHAGMTVESCNTCQEVGFTDSRGEVQASVALGRLFGEFDLVGGLDAVGAPGREVLMYRAPDLLVRAALRVVEAKRWFRADDDLWICHDGEHLLFAHDNPSVSHLVGA